MDEPESTRVIVKNLPSYFTEADLRREFSVAGEITNSKTLTKPSGKSRGFGFVGFKTSSMAVKAISHFDGTYFDTCRIRVELAKPIGDPALDECYSRRRRLPPPDTDAPPPPKDDGDPDFDDFVAASRARNARPSWNDGPVLFKGKTKKNQEEPPREVDAPPPVTTRLYVTNIPYNATKEALLEFFGRFGDISEVLVPVDWIAKRPKGFAIITFANSEAVELALGESVIFEGRHLQLKQGNPSPAKPTELNDDDECFQHKKARLQKSENPRSWNALFLNKNTVMEATAALLGFTKAQLLNPESNDLATRITLAESQLVRETREMFEKA
jgi:multiple RNA-binding domain-containing protein 1